MNTGVCYVVQTTKQQSEVKNKPSYEILMKTINKLKWYFAVYLAVFKIIWAKRSTKWSLWSEEKLSKEKNVKAK